MPGTPIGGVPQQVPMIIAEGLDPAPETTFNPYWDPTVQVQPGYVVLLDVISPNLLDPTTWSDVVFFQPVDGALMYSDDFSVNSQFPPLDIGAVQKGIADGSVPVFLESDRLDFTEYKVDTPGAAPTLYHIFSDPVPEPASMVTLGLGVMGLIARRRRKATT